MRVVVVGAGIVGAAIAYRLSKRKVDVTVLDKARPGSGASSHSFAWINATAKSPVSYHDFNRRSMDLWRRFAQDLDCDLGLTWGGQLQWEATPEGAESLRAKVAELQSWGYPCRLVDEVELRDLEPGLVPGPVTGAALSEADGHVDPQKVVDACLLRASEAGATVLTEKPVIGLGATGLAGGGTRIESVQTEQDEIPCDVVVLATGVDTTKLAAIAGVKVPQEDSPGVVMRTSACPPLLSRVSVVYAPSSVDGEHPEIHLRQMADGVVQIGEGSQESLRQDDSQEHADDLLARAAHFVPALAGATATPVPVGYRPMPLDGYPVLGFPRRCLNTYIALTHSGVTLAPLVAEVAALEIVDGAANIEFLDPYRPDRFA